MASRRSNVFRVRVNLATVLMFGTITEFTVVENASSETTRVIADTTGTLGDNEWKEGTPEYGTSDTAIIEFRSTGSQGDTPPNSDGDITASTTVPSQASGSTATYGDVVGIEYDTTDKDFTITIDTGDLDLDNALTGSGQAFENNEYLDILCNIKVEQPDP